MTPILQVQAATQSYPLPRSGLFGARRRLTVLDGVDFVVNPGQAVGLVGESGAGKTTLTRLLTGLERPRAGRVLFDGADIWAKGPPGREFRRAVQVVMQNPRSSLDPRMRVGAALLEPLRSLAVPGDHAARLAQVTAQVGLAADMLDRYPHEFSGGQLQRLAIARALMPGPRVLIADEPVSALDVSIQAQVLNLLRDLVADLGLSLVLIAHDLSVVAYTTSHAHVIARGRIVESGPPLNLFTQPRSDECRALVSAVLTVEGGLSGRALGDLPERNAP